MKTKSKLRQQDMAQELGISTGYINLLFSGKKPVNLKLAYKWSKVFPEKNLEWWLNASPTQIKNFFQTNLQPEKVIK